MVIHNIYRVVTENKAVHPDIPSRVYIHIPHEHKTHETSFHSTVVDCETLNNPANGQVSHPDGTTFTQTATYSCDTGYNLMGDNTRTCQADGMWSGNQPTCMSESNLTVHM